MSTPPDLGSILNNILSAISNVIAAVASAIADNATVIGTVLILGALVGLVVAVGTKAFRPIIGWFRGLF